MFFKVWEEKPPEVKETTPVPTVIEDIPIILPPKVEVPKIPQKKQSASEQEFVEKLERLEAHRESEKQGVAADHYASVHNVKWKTLLREVIEAGFRFLGQKGSHMQFKNPASPENGIVTIPRHGDRQTVSPGVVSNVRKKIRTPKQSQKTSDQV